MASLAAGAAACSLGFDRFDPSSGDAQASGDSPSSGDGGSSDASSVSDTSSGDAESSDGGCPGLQACTAPAATCGTQCTQTYQSCTAACSNSQCRQQCKQAETGCRTQCANTCTTCTAAAGCYNSTQCAAASQM